MLAGLLSSPECDWKIDVVAKYTMRLMFPLALVCFFVMWYFFAPFYVKNKLLRRNDVADATLAYSSEIFFVRNTIIAVASFLWITVLYPLTMFQTMSAWDCTKQNDVLRTLDMDPDVSCTGDDKTWITLLLLSVLFFSVYCVGSVAYMCVKHLKAYPWHKMPAWVDPQNCGAYTIHAGACNSCEDCAKRQQFSWLFRRYHSSIYFWEYLVILHKILLMGKYRNLSFCH